MVAKKQNFLFTQIFADINPRDPRLPAGALAQQEICGRFFLA